MDDPATPPPSPSPSPTPVLAPVPYPAPVPAATPAAIDDDAVTLAESLTVTRDRLLASLTLIAGIGLALAIPFALRAGAEFFLPTTAALVIAIALVPLLEWFERRGVPSALAAGMCVLIFLSVAGFAILSIVIPAIDWVRLVPERIGKVKDALAPILTIYKNLEKFINRTVSQLPSGGPGGGRTVRIETPNSMLDLLTQSAPHLIIQLFFALLVIFFFLSHWTGMRKQTITRRGSFKGALTAAIVWWLGMDSPLMWGGIVAVLNYVPYLGPIVSAILLAVGGLMVFDDAWTALLPPAIFITMHVIEANAITPLIVGKRVHVNPLLILLSLSFWAWVWGTTGALLAIPLLIIFKTIFAAAGTPDIAGFLFEQGTLTHVGEEEEDEPAEVR